jgi:hypothetical protein
LGRDVVQSGRSLATFHPSVLNAEEAGSFYPKPVGSETTSQPILIVYVFILCLFNIAFNNALCSLE